MEPNNRKGALASGQGKVLEENVISTFARKGFEVVMWSEWNRSSGGDLEMIKRFLAAGFPVVIEKGYELPDSGWWGHYLTIYGYDDQLEELYSQDSYLGPFDGSGRVDGYTEFLLKSEKHNLEMRIECKWQQSTGSVDEKFPYLYLNCIEAMPEKHILIIVDGGGAKDGAVRWLKNAACRKLFTDDNSRDKQIDVFNLSDFIKWANLKFR